LPRCCHLGNKADLPCLYDDTAEGGTVMGKKSDQERLDQLRDASATFYGMMFLPGNFPGEK
jgi:hypothetical protein